MGRVGETPNCALRSVCRDVRGDGRWPREGFPETHKKSFDMDALIFVRRVSKRALRLKKCPRKLFYDFQMAIKAEFYVQSKYFLDKIITIYRVSQ